jgi:hypothetical protein
VPEVKRIIEVIDEKKGGEGVTAYTDKVKRAVKDPDWQAYRVRMKGKPLETKVRMLRSYWALNCTGRHPEGELCRPCLRVDNYIKALCRGGQVRAGESLRSFIEHGWYEEK